MTKEPEASLSERLRETALDQRLVVLNYANLLRQAAAALDAKDGEIVTLRQQLADAEHLAEQWAGSNARAEAAEATVARLEASGIALADACAAYRDAHDLHGDCDMRSGQAWDQMRRAEQKLRAVLSPAPPLTAVQQSVRDGTFGVRSASPAPDQGEGKP